MLNFIVRRAIWTVLVMFAITVLVFVIFFKTPGVDPARQIAGRNPSPQVMAEIRHQFGLDRPFPVQYGLMMKKIFISRDLVSYSNQGQKVVPEIVAAAPATLSLVFGAALIWVVMAIVMGRRGRGAQGHDLRPAADDHRPDRHLHTGVLARRGRQPHHPEQAITIRSCSAGSRRSGTHPLTQDPLLWFKGLVLPWITLSILYIGFYARVLRASLLEIQNEDYIRTARAKGLTERRVLLRHTLRNSMITFVSLFGLDFGVLVAGGALLTEVVFGIHGVGYLTYQSLTNLDLPVIMATVIYGAFFIVLANALVDIAYARLDPRVRLA